MVTHRADFDIEATLVRNLVRLVFGLERFQLILGQGHRWAFSSDVVLQKPAKGPQMFSEPMNGHETFRDDLGANSPGFLRVSYTFWDVLKRTNGAQKRRRSFVSSNAGAALPTL